MALEQLEMATGMNKIDYAIMILQTWEPKDGYHFADSGGKDSSLVRDLLIKSGVKYDGHYCESPIDPPQIRQFLKEHHPETQFDNHTRNFWKLVVQKSLPMRNRRWCCERIKEAGGEGRVVVVGNRKYEGNVRRNQCFIETPQDRAKYSKHIMNKIFVRPILEFTDYDVWDYIRRNNVPYCSIYDEGAKRKGYGEGLFKRLGCVLCPFSNHIELEERYFPKIVANWKRACGRIVEETKARGYRTKKGKPVRNKFETGEEMYQWWVSRKGTG